jgi:uncharacterized protein involved in exopolysaccharide biosynthesis
MVMNIEKKKLQGSDLDVLSDEVAIIDLFRVVRDSYKSIASFTVIFSLLAIAYAFVLPPVYKVNLSMIPTEKQSTSSPMDSLSGLGGLASFAGLNMPQSYDGVDTSLAIMQSRVFLEEFLVNNNILQELYPDDWDISSQAWIDKSPEMWSAVNSFRGILEVKQDINSGVIDVFIEWEDPIKGSLWLNTLIKEINLHLQSEVINDGNSNLNYLQEQLIGTKLASIENIIYGLIGEQTKEIMLAKVNQEYGFKVLDPAVVPLERISPRRKVITILGTIVGLIFGIGYAFSMRLYRNLRDINEGIS